MMQRMTTAPNASSPLDTFFGLGSRGTTVRREVLAGATTFVTMAYILFVNPQILGAAAGEGHAGALLTSTALVAAVMTVAMGLAANLPLALAPGMGLNAVGAFQLVGGMHLSYAEAMGVIVAEGVVITLLVLTGLRQVIVRSVPLPLKRAIAIGIGLFLALIGFKNAGFVSAGGGVLTLGEAGRLDGVRVALVAPPLLFPAWLVARNVRGALLIGMAASTVAALVARALGAGFAPHVAELPSALVAAPDFGLVGHVSFGFLQIGRASCRERV